MDAAPHPQACDRGFCPAKFLDGDRQGPKDRLGDAVARSLSRASRGGDDADPDYRAEVLVHRRD